VDVLDPLLLEPPPLELPLLPPEDPPRVDVTPEPPLELLLPRPLPELPFPPELPAAALPPPLLVVDPLLVPTVGPLGGPENPPGEGCPELPQAIAAPHAMAPMASAPQTIPWLLISPPESRLHFFDGERNNLRRTFQT
jgi:hypothetical protein